MKKSELRQIIKEELNRMLSESKASEEAKKKGLKSAGFGRWADKSGKIVAKTQGDKLVMTKKSTKPASKPSGPAKKPSSTGSKTNLTRRRGPYGHDYIPGESW